MLYADRAINLIYDYIISKVGQLKKEEKQTKGRKYKSGCVSVLVASSSGRMTQRTIPLTSGGQNVVSRRLFWPEETDSRRL